MSGLYVVYSRQLGYISGVDTSPIEVLAWWTLYREMAAVFTDVAEAVGIVLLVGERAGGAIVLDAKTLEPVNR